MATKKAAKARGDLSHCICCGTELTPENCRAQSTKWSIDGISHYCIDCEESYYEALVEAEGISLALFHCCAAFNVPCKPLVLGTMEEFAAAEEPWKFYIDRLEEAGEDRDGDKVLTFFDGYTDILKIFGAQMSKEDFSERIKRDRMAIDRQIGTKEQRRRWGVGAKFTNDTYNELDRQYEVRANSYKGQTITPQMEDALIRVAKCNYQIDNFLKHGKVKEALDLQKMVDSILSSEQMRKKDEKPVENFTPDAWVVAMEKAGLMENGMFLTKEQTVKAINKLIGRKKYDYSLDVADQIELNIVNNARKNADMALAYDLPQEMEVVDDWGEFEEEEGEEEEERKKYAQLTPVTFTKEEAKK